MKCKKIVLTGGGTAGHVMPHLAMLDCYQSSGWQVFYIGSKGIEKKLLAETKVPYYPIATGKLRRYFSWQNFTDVFRILLGLAQSIKHLYQIKPDLVFSKGGFVSVPVAIAAWLLRIPLASHESDLTPGLANKIIKPFAKQIFYAFPETEKFIKNGQLVGIPIRQDLLSGDPDKGKNLCGFADNHQPTLLVMGGSLGAQRINESLAEALPQLVKKFNVIHITGKGKGIDFEDSCYACFEFLSDQLRDVFALADLVVSRAGANSIFEFLALRKPMLLIPLEIGSRGDQVHNARCFEQNGLAKVLREQELSASSLHQAISQLEQSADQLLDQQNRSELANDSALKLMTSLSGLNRV